jgi:hypothetical protein
MHINQTFGNNGNGATNAFNSNFIGQEAGFGATMEVLQIT